MKSFNLIKRRMAGSAGLAALFLGCASAFAQAPGGDKAAGGVTPSITRFFGTTTNFIAKAEVHVLDQQQHETTSMDMGFEMLGVRIRMDINMAEVKSKEMSPAFATTMKQMGMDRMSTILLPDKKTILTIYPGLKSYDESPMPKEDVEGAYKTYKLEKNRLAKETIDGHPCEKNEVTLTDEKGGKEKVILWNATDMKNFPVQLQMTEDDSVLIMKFKDVKLGRPDFAHFDAPANMTKYDNIKALMDAATQRMTENAK